MHYIYHAVPKDLEGTVLYPLHTLKQTKPELFRRKVAKYEQRKGILERTIPPLDCLWNDVLHFTAIPPDVLVRELAKAGRQHQPMNFFQIDVRSLKPDRTIVYTYETREKLRPVPEREFVTFQLKDLPLYASIPEFTKHYYRESYVAGERPLLYHGVPHILYKGTLDVRDLPIITV